ncbi:MAG: hypothetical protein ACJASQ_001003 [Crocinitomicaceae bacterium]|jgi:hypothetical protein
MIRNIILFIVLALLSVGYFLGAHYYDGNDYYIDLLFQVLILLFIIFRKNFTRNKHRRLSSNVKSTQSYLFGSLAVLHLILGIVHIYRGDRIFGIYNSSIGFAVLFMIVAYIKRKKELLITPKSLLFFGNNKLIFDKTDFYQKDDETLTITTIDQTITIDINHLTQSQRDSLLNDLKSVKISI